jgi:8-oxo-dGTP diphosphatase
VRRRSFSMLRRAIRALYRVAPTSLLNRLVNFFQPHFTVTVAAVVVDGRGRVLLLKHNFRGGSGWGIPGGFLASGEQPEDGLRRELREETGMEVADIELVFVRTATPARQLQIVFRCKPIGEPAPQSVEIEELGWFATEELPAGLSASQRDTIKKTLGH